MEQRRRAWLAHDDGDEAMLEKQLQEHAIEYVAMHEQHQHMEFLLAKAVSAIQRGETPSEGWRKQTEMLLRLIHQDRTERGRHE